MRRRSQHSSLLCPMEKRAGKNQQSRLCLLATLAAFLWVCLLYFHFVVLGGSSVNESVELDRVSAVSMSREAGVIRHSVTDRSPPINVPRESSDSGDVNNFSTQPKHISQPNDDDARQEIFQDTPYVKEISDDSGSSVAELVDGQKSDDTSEQEFPDGSHSSLPQLIDAQKEQANHAEVDVGEARENFPFMRAMRTTENKSDPCGGRYIYVHDLPSRFNEDMLKQCRSLSLWTNMCKFTTNAGLGPPLENVEEGVFSNTGWYATNQFAVDVIFNNRMKQYDCLTRDSSIAAAVFVPFYAGFDIARYLWGYNISTRDAASLDLVDWLTKRPEWGIMGGKDHFLVAGRITWDFRRLSEEETDWGNKLLFLPAAKNMSMLVVESSPWNANDFGIPYPTYFHPAKDADVFAWQDRMRKLDRNWLFCFAGAPRPDNPKSIRGKLIDECKRSKVGKLLECDFGESKCHSPSSIMQMFQSSVFCLQPQGDSYTRRSAFDSMLAGCIPVFFHPGSAYTQYTWHLPKNYSRYSVFIPEDEIRTKNVSIEQRLSEIPPEQVLMMREEVINLIPRLIYADPRSKLETLKDAFDVAVQAVINKVSKLRKDIIEGRSNDNFIEEISWKYDLLEEGEEVGYHEWDPFFSKPKKDGNAASDGSSAEAAKNSWKNEQRQHS
ncbi:xyloglucan galactosyltransferase MUR3 [Daucus carota subsp. sativus]|uniref:Exostosin GT47 domain-containing protein n=2 Tax=Daucus carota subsp. sativus TaxID=79200 RepID=A0A166FKV9_DAUCS|nr:PREDICTED: xyloglucan galactosyltransferase MUR3-like [Daucus carota subsp. sativus]XP_017229109.1 PREDICTED: xyloglucan galactosyltransferase MUR3-like [Daucus carota subsp. sativus]